jgi:ATP-dependent Clp protease ATP-binding subunit ClpC
MAQIQENFDELTGLQRFTDNAKKAVVSAHDLAKTHGNREVGQIHVFLALIQNPSSLISNIFEQIGLDIENTKQSVLSEIESRSIAGATRPRFSLELKDLINQSFLVAERLSHVYVGSEHLLIAMLEVSTEQFVEELISLGLTSERVTNIVTSIANYPPGILSQTVQSTSLEDDQEGDLPFFCRDMNRMAAKGEFLNITGRDAEIERLIHILARKTKNNPILVGDAGVGKTAVVQGLVQRILRGDVPPSFVDKQVLAIDISAIIAGAKVRGDVEERILGLVNDVMESENKIIFIDEIHMIVGAGGSGGRDPMDIGNILKPYLTDSRLRVIGATTNAEFRRYFDDDPALSRRFQPIEVPEIDRDSAVEILRNLRKDFESYHGVKIKDEALTAAVDLSAKFITDRYLPDKAIDLVDEAAASLKIGREISIEPKLSALGEKLMDVQKQKEAALTKQDIKLAATHKQTEEQLTDQIADLMEGNYPTPGRQKQVDANLIRNIVVSWTKIPLAAGDIDNAKLRDLYRHLREKIVGEDQVLTRVANAIKRSHMGLVNSRRPLASFLFLGPTGVGKTELAKTIAQELFGSSDLIYQLNMSEYMEMHSVAKLIGSPPGYVGYQEGGQLTEHIRRKPYSVVLFDEIEKAHPEVLNILLQILEEGELTDGRGRTANFRNTIIILTSNIGAEEVSQDNRLGFNVQVENLANSELDQAFSEMQGRLLDILKKQVRPELLNRLDEIAIFRGLNQEDCLEISKNYVKSFVTELAPTGIDLDVAANVAKLINDQGYSKEYGARNIRRKMQELLENGLAEYLLDNKLKRSPKQKLHIKAKVDGEKVVFSHK